MPASRQQFVCSLRFLLTENKNSVPRLESVLGEFLAIDAVKVEGGRVLARRDWLIGCDAAFEPGLFVKHVQEGRFVIEHREARTAKRRPWLASTPLVPHRQDLPLSAD